MKSLSHVQLFATPWTVAYQVPPFTAFSRQAYCSGLPFPSPGDLPDPGIEPRSPALRAGTFREVPPIILREELRNRRGDQMHSLLINTPVHSTYNVHIIVSRSFLMWFRLSKGVNTIYKGLCFFICSANRKVLFIQNLSSAEATHNFQSRKDKENGICIFL